MRKEMLITEFTGEQELEVYDRLQREVDDEWNKRQQTPQIEGSSKLQSRKDVEKRIIIRALDSFLTLLPAKESLEREIGEHIPDNDWGKLKEMDRKYLLKELKQMCRDKRLPISGDKKTLAWRLLRYEQRI